MSDWQRQPGLACEYCGGPGHFIAIPPKMTAAWFAETTIPTFEPIVRHITCPEHKYLVSQRALREQDPEYYAHRHGRPETWGETDPERTRRALKKIFEKLDAAGIDTTELRAKAREKFGEAQ